MTSDPPSPRMLLELGEDLGWPPVTLGTLTITGEDLWRWAAAAAAPIERRAWLGQLADPLLVATPASRERMARWHARGAWSVPTTPARIHEDLLFGGDPSMLGPTVAAFDFMPEPVRDYVLREVAFEAVGASSRAWIGASTMLDRDGVGRPWTVRLSGADRHAADLIDTVLHECAHAWTLPTPIVCITAQGEVGLRAFLAAEGLAEQADKKVAFGERIAEALALIWGAR
jgi:hypothetical protein